MQRHRATNAAGVTRSRLSLAAAVGLLLLADLLAFHDGFEPHAVRDWLMLAGSALAVVSLVAGSTGLRIHR